MQVAPLIAPGIGNPGPLRLLAPTLAGQASWLLIFALVGLFAESFALARPSGAGSPPLTDAWTAKRRRRIVGVFVWGGWLLAWVAIFSFARFYHIYYLRRWLAGPGRSTGGAWRRQWSALRRRQLQADSEALAGAGR